MKSSDAKKTAETAVRPPVTREIPHDVSAHGDTRVDPYYWLRERDNPEVIAHLEAENAYAERCLDHTRELQQQLYDEMVGRIQETDASVPEVIDDYFYYSRTEAGKQYEIHCRKKGTLNAAEEIILDENVLAEGHAYFAVGAFAVSPDHRLLVYSVDMRGDEGYELFVKDLDTGKILDPGIPDTKGEAVWANDSETIFYTVIDASRRPCRVCRRRLGTPLDKDVCIFEEKDEAFFAGVSKTRSRAFILVSVGSHTTTEEHFVSADLPEGELHVVQKRRHEVEYYTAHHGERFFILTNDKAKNFKVVAAPVNSPSAENWSDEVAHRDAVKIDDIDVFRDHLVSYERENGLKRIRIVELASGEAHEVSFDEPVYTVWADGNSLFDTTILRFVYTSPVTPRTVYDYDMTTRARTLRKRYEVLGGYDPEDYTCERVFASAHDGTRVPMSLVYRKGTPRDGTAPLFLYAYGSYGASIEPYFVSARLSLLNRGFVFAIAHVRGGGEMGRVWHDQGKLFNKRNTFSDFIACAEHLIARGYTTAGRIVVSGGSAGGMLVGAVLNMRSDLFGAAIANVPFVDVTTTMQDDTIPLTVIEYEEWGNPAEKKAYEYIRSYSPYDNVHEQDYPPILITAGLNDPRVQYWEPAKWAARLRARKTGDSVVALKTKMAEGHSGASGRYDYLRDLAVEYAFLLDSLNRA